MRLTQALLLRGERRRAYLLGGRQEEWKEKRGESRVPADGRCESCERRKREAERGGSIGAEKKDAVADPAAREGGEEESFGSGQGGGEREKAALRDVRLTGRRSPC